MYLNASAASAKFCPLSVEPKHKMYLNTFCSQEIEPVGVVEPKHKMYLNG